LGFGFSLGFGVWNLGFPDVISSSAQLAELVSRIESFNRIAVDTEADSLHSYFEKLCLLQLSFAGQDYLIDPLAGFDLAPLAAAFTEKELVLQGADFDLRLMRRSFGFIPSRVFDTVIAARLMGIREFSLAALVQQFFDVALPKGSQKADWAKRPLPPRMAEYAMNDTHYLLPLAEKLEHELSASGRLAWFRESCQRAIVQASVQRERDGEEVWRIAGGGALRGRPAAILRALWHWRDREARAVDRPAFHILQNQQLVASAITFDAGEVPDFRHFSPRRRREFLSAANEAMQLPESEWPEKRRGVRLRPTAEMDRRTDELRRHRDHVAAELKIEPSFIAPRNALEAIARDESQKELLLVPWQRELLGLQ
jgi:ribonuclease D